jgi:hypothetical protein
MSANEQNIDQSVAGARAGDPREKDYGNGNYSNGSYNNGNYGTSNLLEGRSAS